MECPKLKEFHRDHPAQPSPAQGTPTLCLGVLFPCCCCIPWGADVKVSSGKQSRNIPKWDEQLERSVLDQCYQEIY